MRERIFPFIIALSALSVSASAAFYSVFGLSHLFAGASTQVIIMAGALEVAKLVVASLLYQYWDKINKLLRIYFILATIVLMVITSGGIYGYLSGAYQETATQSEMLDRQVAIIEMKQDRFEEQKSDLKIEKEALSKSVSDLRIALSNPQQVQYIDRESGQLITTTSSSARRALQKELNTSIIERDTISQQLLAITDSIALYDVKILDTQINNETSRELGPLKYMAELTGMPMASVVNWFMILIIFVFDPLAIAMVVAANMAFEQLKTKENVYGETVPKEKIYEVLDAKSEEWDEKRMNIIGQNGNDGIHYDLEEEKPKVKIIEKIIEDPRMNHPRIQEAIKHAKRAGEWD